MVDIIHLKSGYYKSRFILPSEFKELMKNLKQNSYYTGYLTIDNGYLVDSHNTIISSNPIVLDALKECSLIENHIGEGL